MKHRIYATPAVKGLNMQICKCLFLNMSSFHPEEVVGRGSETQLQGSDILNSIT